MIDISLAKQERFEIRDIFPDALQPRQSYDRLSLDQLASSLRDLGMLNKPLVEMMERERALGYIGTWEDSKLKRDYIKKARKSEGKLPVLVVGHRRWLAALRAGYSYVDCVVAQKELSVIERRILQVNENIYTPLPPWMRASSVVELFYLAQELRTKRGEAPYTKTDLAADIGMSESTISDYFRFMERLDPKIREGVENDRVGWGVALELARLKPERQLSTLVQVEEGNIKNVGVYVDGLLRADTNFNLVSPKVSNGSTSLAEARHALAESDRVMRIALRMDCLDGSEELRGCFDALDNITYYFSKKITDTIGKRRKWRGRHIRQQERFDDLIEESLELNRKNRLEKQPDLNTYVRLVSLDDLDYDLNNPRTRFNDEDIEELAHSIRQCGLINPVHLRLKEDGRYRVDHGNSRVRAHHLLWERSELEQKLIAAYVLDEMPESAVFRLKQDENSQQHPNPEEEAECLNVLYKNMREQDMVESVAGFSRVVGKSETKVRRALHFDEGLCPGVKELVRDGLMSYSTALPLLRRDTEGKLNLDENGQLEVAMTAVLGGYNHAEVRRTVEARYNSRNQMSLWEDINDDFRKYFSVRAKKRLENELNGIVYRLDSLRVNNLDNAVRDDGFRAAFWRLYDTMQLVYDKLGGEWLAR